MIREADVDGDGQINYEGTHNSISAVPAVSPSRRVRQDDALEVNHTIKHLCIDYRAPCSVVWATVIPRRRSLRHARFSLLLLFITRQPVVRYYPRILEYPLNQIEELRCYLFVCRRQRPSGRAHPDSPTPLISARSHARAPHPHATYRCHDRAAPRTLAMLNPPVNSGAVHGSWRSERQGHVEFRVLSSVRSHQTHNPGNRCVTSRYARAVQHRYTRSPSFRAVIMASGCVRRIAMHGEHPSLPEVV